jgi:glyoxylate carboligase
MRECHNKDMDVKAVEKTLKEWLKLKPQYVDIIMAGRIFGGRFGESSQQPESFFCGDKFLRINFDPYEILTVFNPREVNLNQDDDLVIVTASEVRFGWYYYGRDPISKNWCEDIYINKNTYVENILIFDSSVKRKRIIKEKEVFVKLIARYIGNKGEKRKKPFPVEEVKEIGNTK